jgi:hypothetical protein
MTEDIEMKKLLELLDVALSSKDPRIKDQLRRLLMVVALIEPDVTPSGDIIKGPLSSLYSKLREFEDRLFRIELNNHQTYSPGIYTNTPPITLGQYNQPNVNPWIFAGTTTNTVGAASVSVTLNQEQLDLFNTEITKI